MSQSYRAFVEAVVDNVIEEGGVHRLPSDTLARAAAQGFCPDTFETDVLNEVAVRSALPDPDQQPLPF